MADIKSLDSDEIRKHLGIKKVTRILDAIIPIVIGPTMAIVLGIISKIMFDEMSWKVMTSAYLILFFGIYLVWGLRIVPAQQVWIVEEFGKYKRELEAGWNLLCLPGIVDKVVNDSITTKRQNLKIVDENKKAVEVDFNCGSSAPVTIEVWFQITNAFLWHYRISNPCDWFHDQVSAFLQPILERRTLDEARGAKRRISQLYRKLEDKDVSDNAEEIHFINSDAYEIDLREYNEKTGQDRHSQIPRPNPDSEEYKVSFKDYVENRIGVEWTDLLISDIQIPDDIQKVRKQELEASTDRRARKEKAIGYVDAIVAIKSAASDAGITLSDEQAIEIYNQNKDREAFQGSGANVTIVSSDVRNAIASLFPNRNQGGS